MTVSSTAHVRARGFVIVEGVFESSDFAAVEAEYSVLVNQLAQRWL